MLGLRQACLCMLLASLASDQQRTRETFSDVAERMVKAINAADYEGVRKDFGEEMAKAFPMEKSKAFFKGISSDYGTINRLEAPEFNSAARAVFVARCERGALDFTLTLDEKGRVVGMLFKPHSDLPVPQR